MTNETSDSYERIATWYDVEHDGVTEDSECYASILGDLFEGPRRVLEIGAGTGRVAVALALAGHRVTAVEPSGAMRARLFTRLAQLPERVRRRVRAVEGSAASPALDTSEQFDAILFGQGVFAHLVTHDERQVALTRAHAHLADTGRVIVDVDLTGPRRLLESTGLMWWQGSWTYPPDNVEVSHFVTGLPGPAPDVVEAVHIYDIQQPDGTVRRTITRMPLAVLNGTTVELALLRAGFSMESAYGGYGLVPLSAASDRMIAVAGVQPSHH